MEEAECSNTGADSGPGCSQQHDNSEMDADLLPLPAETEHRVSELFPRNLVSLFASTPALMLKWPQAGKAEVTRSMAIAGSQLNGELDLQRMQVVVRIRPPMAKGLPRWSKENCIHALSSCSVAIAPPESSQGYKNGDRGQTYTFSRVFGADTSQQDYFEATAAPMVRQLVRKKQQASVMMAYGISAAGKTYTIEGTKNEQGVVPRALELLFQELAACQEPLRVCVQNYEVYNESIYDLLDAEGLGPQGQRPVLRLKEDPQGRIFVAGLSEVEVDNPEAAMEQLRRGSRQRQRAATTLNYSSSRSHSIFVVCLCRKNGASAADAGTNAEGSVGGGKLGQISFVDLAGSERAARTGNVGVRLKESVAINSSLMTLGRCLEALRWNQQHRLAEPRLVPFRESKVTYLFRDVLHGWGQILLSVNVSPNAKDYDETTHVLKYAALAAQIGTAARLEAPARALKAVSPNITKKRAAPPSKPVPAGKDATVCSAAEAAVAHAEHAEPMAVDPEELAALHEQIEELQGEVERLTEEVHKAEEKAALAETEIREEVSNEMGELLREMEANYKERLASETLILEQKFKRQARQGGSKPADSDPMPAAAAEAAAQSSKAELDAALARIAALEAELQGGAKPAGGGPVAAADGQSSKAELDAALARIAALEAELQGGAKPAGGGPMAAADGQSSKAELDAALAHIAALEGELQGGAKPAGGGPADGQFSNAELDAGLARIGALEAELQAAEARAADAQAQLRDGLQRRISEEITQINANKSMEAEMLEQQLERARKDNLALQRRLEAALGLAAGPGPARKQGEAPGKEGGRGAGGTPHSIALAYARQAAAADSPQAPIPQAIAQADQPAADPGQLQGQQDQCQGQQLDHSREGNLAAASSSRLGGHGEATSMDVDAAVVHTTCGLASATSPAAAADAINGAAEPALPAANAAAAVEAGQGAKPRGKRTRLAEVTFAGDAAELAQPASLAADVAAATAGGPAPAGQAGAVGSACPAAADTGASIKPADAAMAKLAALLHTNVPCIPACRAAAAAQRGASATAEPTPSALDSSPARRAGTSAQQSVPADAESASTALVTSAGGEVPPAAAPPSGSSHDAAPELAESAVYHKQTRRRHTRQHSKQTITHDAATGDVLQPAASSTLTEARDAHRLPDESANGHEHAGCAAPKHGTQKGQLAALASIPEIDDAEMAPAGPIGIESTAEEPEAAAGQPACPSTHAVHAAPKQAGGRAGRPPRPTRKAVSFAAQGGGAAGQSAATAQQTTDARASPSPCAEEVQQMGPSAAQPPASASTASGVEPARLPTEAHAVQRHQEADTSAAGQPAKRRRKTMAAAAAYLAAASATTSSAQETEIPVRPTRASTRRVTLAANQSVARLAAHVQGPGLTAAGQPSMSVAAAAESASAAAVNSATDVSRDQQAEAQQSQADDRSCRTRKAGASRRKTRAASVRFAAGDNQHEEAAAAQPSAAHAPMAGSVPASLPFMAGEGGDPPAAAAPRPCNSLPVIAEEDSRAAIFEAQAEASCVQQRALPAEPAEALPAEPAELEAMDMEQTAPTAAARQQDAGRQHGQHAGPAEPAADQHPGQERASTAGRAAGKSSRPAGQPSSFALIQAPAEPCTAEPRCMTAQEPQPGTKAAHGRARKPPAGSRRKTRAALATPAELAVRAERGADAAGPSESAAAAAQAEQPLHSTAASVMPGPAELRQQGGRADHADVPSNAGADVQRVSFLPVASAAVLPPKPSRYASRRKTRAAVQPAQRPDDALGAAPQQPPQASAERAATADMACEVPAADTSAAAAYSLPASCGQALRTGQHSADVPNAMAAAEMLGDPPGSDSMAVAVKGAGGKRAATAGQRRQKRPGSGGSSRDGSAELGADAGASGSGPVLTNDSGLRCAPSEAGGSSRDGSSTGPASGHGGPGRPVGAAEPAGQQALPTAAVADKVPTPKALKAKPAGGKKKRLLPPTLLSNGIREALGELNPEDLPLMQQAGARRTRRMTGIGT